jgi:DNA-binding GntR family transcriptional regulator
MHRRIYRAIRARDAEAARTAMSEHLILTEQRLASEEVPDGESDKNNTKAIKSTIGLVKVG